jgi:hypothetical protein
MYIAKPSETPSPDGTPVYDFSTEYQVEDAEGNPVTMLQLEDVKSLKELQDRKDDCEAKLAAIELLK